MEISKLPFLLIFAFNLLGWLFSEKEGVNSLRVAFPVAQGLPRISLLAECSLEHSLRLRRIHLRAGSWTKGQTHLSLLHMSDV